MAKTIKKHWDIAVVVGIGLFLTIAGIVGMFGMISLPSSVSAATSATATVSVQATVDETIEINVSSSDMNLGTLDSGTISATSNNFTVGTNAGNGYTVTLKGTGSTGGDDPGLYNASTTNLIVSADASPLTTGAEGYGAQGTSTDSDVGIYAKYDVYDTPNDVGGITETSASDFCSSSSPTIGDQTTLRLKATISPITDAGSYADTLTLTAVGSF